MERLPHARLLIAAGRHPEAAALLEREVARVPSDGTPDVLEVAWALERARVNEQLGNRERASESYRFVADVWRHADAELQPYVEEAKAALRRLAAEPSR